MPALIERPKMSLAMWAALKSHIMRQREKKKQEQEADAAVERLRREQELKRKQDAMTLEEIKDQLSQLDQKLKELKEEKHQFFLQLKKVLHEDDTRKRALVKEAELAAAAAMNHSFGHAPMPTGAPPPPIYIQGINRAQAMYKVAVPPQQTIMPPGALKRPLSPSPPPANYQSPYSYKTQVTSFGPKPIPFPSNQPPVYYTHVTAQTTSSPMTSSAGGPSPYQAAYGTQFVPPSHQELSSSKQHVPAQAYHVQHIQQPTFPRSVAQPLEHAASQKAAYPDEKFYVQQPSVIPMRNVGSMSTGQPVLPIQQQAKGSYSSGQQQIQHHQYPGPPTTRYY